MNFSKFLYMFFCFSSFNNGAKLSLYAGLLGNMTVESLLRVDPKSGVSVISMKFTPSYIRDVLGRIHRISQPEANCSFAGDKVHTRLSAHFSSSAIHLLCPGPNSTRYKSSWLLLRRDWSC